MKLTPFYHSNISNHLICTCRGYKPPNMHMWGPGVRDIYALHYIVSGKGILETRDTAFPLKAGESFIIFPHTEVYYYPDKHDPWEYVWIEFKGDEAQRLVALAGLEPEKPVVSESPDNLEPYFHIIENTNAKPFDKIRSDAKLRLLLSYYMEYYPKEASIRQNDYVETAKEYIENNYWKTSITVSDIVNVVNIERSYLFRLFKDATGMSVSNYLTVCRIQRACELLKSSNLSIKSIACSVGYSDPMYFSKVFKKATSYPPSEYMTLLEAACTDI